MQGLIIDLKVKLGDEVWEGRPVAIMEAMKMEHEIKSDVSGRVKEITINEGDTIYENHQIILVESSIIDVPDSEKELEIDLDYIRPDLKEALSRKQASHDKNRPEAVAKRRKTGHRTARENIEDLCDEGTFVEYGSFHP